MPGGRPPIKYNPDKHPQYARALAIEGLTNEEIAERMGMAKSTLQTWRKKYPEFSAAIKEGKDEADAKVEMSLFKRATGYDVEEEKALNIGGDLVIARVRTHIHPDPTSCIFWLKNRKPGKWRDRQEITGANGGPVRIATAKDLTDDDLARIALGEKHE